MVGEQTRAHSPGLSVLLFLCIHFGLLVSVTAAGEAGLKITPEEIEAKAPPIEAIKAHVAKLVSFGSRVAGTPGNRKAREYIIEALRGMGYQDAAESGPPKDDDALKPTPLAEAAFQADPGQTFSSIAPAQRSPRNIRVSVLDEDGSITGGEIVVVGTGLDGKPLTEKLVLPAANAGKALVVGDRPFKEVSSVTAKNLQGQVTGNDSLQAGYGVRYFIGTHRFWGVAPHDAGDGKLTFPEGPPVEGAASEYQIYGVWPNGPAITTTGPDGLTGPIVYGGAGRPQDFDGKKVEGALVLLELTDQTRWTVAAGLGAKAVIVIEPEVAFGPIMQRLFVASPIEYPRLWIPREHGVALRKAVADAAAQSKVAKAHVRMEMKWQKGLWENVFLLVPGSGRFQGPIPKPQESELIELLEKLPTAQAEIKARAGKLQRTLLTPGFSVNDFLTDLEKLVGLLKTAGSADAGLQELLDKQTELAETARSSTIILSAFYDSISIVPALAPGAEQALGCAALLELAKKYRETRPARDTLLLFADAHFMAMKGEREFFGVVEDLPEATPEEDLKPILVQNPIKMDFVNGLLARGDKALPDREPMVEITRKAAEASAAKDDLYQDLVVDDSENQVKKTWGVAGGLFLVLGALVFLLKGLRLRRPILAISFSVGTIILIYSVAVPLGRRALTGEEGADTGKVLDDVLKSWKEVASVQGAERERDVRLLRSNGLAITEEYKKAEEAGDGKRLRELREKGEDSTPEYKNALGQQKEYDAICKLLYCRTHEGRSVPPPDDIEKLQKKLSETAAITIQRLKDELAWGKTERARRMHNEPFAALVQARFPKKAERQSLFVSLDLSAGHPGLGLFYKGTFYNQPGVLESRYRGGAWSRSVKAVAEAVERGLGVKETGARIPDTLIETKGRAWQTYLAAPLSLSAEIAIQAQIRGITLATPFDRRMAWDTPQDDLGPERVSSKGAWERIAEQMRFTGAFVDRLIALRSVTTECRLEIKWTGFSEITIETVRRGGSRSIFPNIPVDGAIVWGITNTKSDTGVRKAYVECTNPLGKTRIVGIRRGARHYFEAYKCDPVTGEIIYAVNKPKHQLMENVSFPAHIGRNIQSKTMELFRAQGLALVDVIDPGRFVPLHNCDLLAGQTESSPLEFGTSHIHRNEPHRVLFAEPGSRVKCLFREGELGLRMAILNVEDEVMNRLLDPKTSSKVSLADARGPGFALGSRKVLDQIPLRAARDLWSLGEQRLNNLREHSIGNARLDNEKYPGPYSVGKASVKKDSNLVTGTDVSWDQDVAGMTFTIPNRPGVYRVELLDGPNRLKLEQPYQFEDATDVEFILTRESPGLHNLTKMRLEKALDAHGSGRYGDTWRLAAEAWGIESRAYPEVLGTANDSVHGVVFYLFLLLPFCFFIERLLFAFPKIEHQIGAFFAIFVLMFALLWLVHPAFALVKAPPVILLAFVIMSLAGIVIGIVYSKFNTEMHRMQGGMQGVQSADVNRGSAAMVAVTLGISQMRRRKVRTLLTCITIVLLTFTALSFTSVVPSMSQASIDLSPGNIKDAPYNGILIRNLNFKEMQDATLDQLREEFAADGIRIAPRYWGVARKIGNQYEQKYFDVLAYPTSEERSAGVIDPRIIQPTTLLGMSPQERPLFLQEDRDPFKDALVAGEWLKEGDLNVCLLPLRLAEKLQAGRKPDVEWTPEQSIGQPVRIGSLEVEVRGIYKSELFNEILDLDGQSITPVDFAASDASRGAAQTGSEEATVENLESASLTRFDHVSSLETLVVPWRLSRLLGANLRSMAVRIENEGMELEANLAALDYRIGRLLNLLEKSLYVGRDGRRILYASAPRLSLTGLGNLVVPLLIAVMILLNTMIGAVYERRREIRIFSALGLAPSHIAALFVAEAFVYATLGAILGYLLGQGVAKVIQFIGVSGLYLNYSSSSAVWVTAIVMLSVLGSTIYPSILAAKEASPSEDRSWSVPKPKGDEISMELPFSFQRELVPGAALFLYDFFESHSESSLGNFTAKEVTMEAFYSQKGQGVCLFFMAWLAPYDLGVSQEVQIYIVPVDEELYVAEASFYRVSGYVDSWQRVNLPFLNTLRKHLLIWRTFSPEQRQDFAERGYAQFQEAFEAIGWPPPEGHEYSGPEDPDLQTRNPRSPDAPPPEKPVIVKA